MQKGLDPTKITTCMKCRKAPSRYYGTWGEEGLCRGCILAMEPSVRRKVMRELHPAERKRWQLDELAERTREKELARREAPASPAAPATPGPAATGGAARHYTEPYRHLEARPTAPRRDADRHERRDHTRLFAELPVRFTVVAGTGRTPSPLQGRSFRSVSRDLSEGGIRIQIRDPALFEIPAECHLHLEITVPDTAVLVHATGVVHNFVHTNRGRETGYLCVQFDSLSRADAETLGRFLTRSRSHRPT